MRVLVFYNASRLYVGKSKNIFRVMGIELLFKNKFLFHFCSNDITGCVQIIYLGFQFLDTLIILVTMIMNMNIRSFQPLVIQDLYTNMHVQVYGSSAEIHFPCFK